MWNIIGFIVTTIALIAAIIFYVMSTSELRRIAKVIEDGLLMAVNNPNINPVYDKRGRIHHWDVTLHPDGEVKSK